MGFSLTDEAAQPLITPYKGGEATRRYYQDAAIRAVMERIARGEKRALLSLATDSGKTFIAVNLLCRIADVGQLRKALFLCDRDELLDLIEQKGIEVDEAIKKLRETLGSSDGEP
jgi:type I restriction enzyme, R subunit